ncbi:helix-turn-helix domain-containing protein [uncultured Chryseobacterium sp.]|uniref:helix-turn-helix domain-containing protein n=1 Tax=uncultured Chryseobacterium sp. TaxID=259322 RepID=UPI0025848E84|nr:helix-turn-helix domain-containing protein [uncultured Chryseobacterium sp.]
MNYHHKILLLIFNLLSFFMMAQDSEKLTYKTISDLYAGYPENDERAMVFVNRYIEKAKKEHCLNKQIIGYEEAIFYTKNVDRKLSYADSTISVALQTKVPDVISRSYLGKGIIYYYNKRQYKQALEQYLKAYQWSQNSDNDYQKNKVVYHLGMVKSYLGDYKEASGHFRNTASYFEKSLKENLNPNPRLNNEAGYFNSIYRLSTCYRNLGLYSQEDSLIDTGLQKLKNINDHLLEYGYFQTGKGVQFLRKGDKNEALKHLKLSRDILLNNQDYGSLTMVYFYLGKAHWLKGNRAESLRYLNKVDSMIHKFHFISPEIRSNYQYLLDDAKQNDNVDGQLYYIDQLLKMDSILIADFPTMVSKIYHQYDRIPLLQDKQLLKKKNNNINLLNISAAITLIIILLILLDYRRRMKKKRIDIKYYELLERMRNQDGFLETMPILSNKKEPFSQEVIEDIKEKLKKFEEQKQFLTKNLTLPKVAKMFGRNHSQLSYVLNEHLKMSFTQYLKILRIKYITNLLIEDKNYLKYKIHVLADQCGMSNRQSFSAHFLEINGMRPTEFIKKRLKEIED